MIIVCCLVNCRCGNETSGKRMRRNIAVGYCCILHCAERLKFRSLFMISPAGRAIAFEL